MAITRKNRCNLEMVCKAYDVRDYDLEKSGVLRTLRDYLTDGFFCTKNIALASFLISQGKHPVDVVPIHRKISFYIFEESCATAEEDFKMRKTKVFPLDYAAAQRQLKSQVDYAQRALESRGALPWTDRSTVKRGDE